MTSTRRPSALTHRARRKLTRLAARLSGLAQMILVPRRLRQLQDSYERLTAQLVDTRETLNCALQARDEARLLQREHARLWATSKSRGAPAHPLAHFIRDGDHFSYFLYCQEREHLTRLDDPFQLGQKTAVRAKHEAGPVQFKTLPATGSPDTSVAFVTVCTDKFAPGLEGLILSILAIYPNFKGDFWVFHDDGLSEFSQRRLLDFYPSFRFRSLSSKPYEVAAEGNSPNQRRIGALGYLTIEALKLDSYARVIVLDSDLIVKGDISPLWSEPLRSDVRVIPDAGALPFTTASKETGNVVFNSGVMSLPHNALGESRFREAIELLPEMPKVECPVLKDFADQKFWNVYLQRYELTYLPANYNANKQLLDRYMPIRHADAAIVHYTSAKPWYSFASRELVSLDERKRALRDRKQFPISYGVWNATYRELVGSRRRAMFRSHMMSTLDQLHGDCEGAGAALIGNGPSLGKTNLRVLNDRVRIAFNWFVNHPEFDHVAVDHLMIMSHMFFGGWHTPRPAFPSGYLEKLTTWSHRPTLWFPYYFRDLVEQTPQLGDYNVNYLLLEKPFKFFAEDIGQLNVDLYDHLSDAHTGVLTAGLPLALHLGCKEISLVGCDASYGKNGDNGDYFYSTEQHTSRSTTTSSLHSTWSAEGPAQYCYRLGHQAAQRRGVLFQDATIDGFLKGLPKQDIPGLRRS